MMSKLVAGLLVVPAVFLGLLLSADYAVVDVRQGDGMRLIVPVPLALARLALSFAPPEARYVHVPEVADYLPHAERIVAELRGVDDGLLVSVEDRDQTVRIEKVGDALQIFVDEGDSVVDVSVPLDAVIDMLRAYDGRGFDTRDLVRAVGRADGDLVHVRDRDQEVKIWVW
jgi:hypothetical protein